MSEAALDVPMPLPTTDFASPNTLAALVIRGRNSLDQDESSFPPDFVRVVRARISNHGLSRLLELAYQASLEKNEGRYPRLRLFVRSENANATPRLLVRFSERVKLQESGDISRLAPAIGSYDYALSVCENGNELCAEGILALEDPGEDVAIGENGLTIMGMPPGLIIRIAGPAALRISEPMLGAHELSAGRVHSIDPFDRALPVETWLRQHAAGVVEQCALQQCLSTAYDQSHVYLLARALWSRVLLTAVELQHGGAFVLIPEGASIDSLTIKNKATDIRLGQSAALFIQACARAHVETECNGFRDAAWEWSRRKRDIQTESLALGHLSAVDGCVVLDRSLNLLGFGGQIEVKESETQLAPRSFADFETQSPRSESDLNRFGTRHRSAFRLCQLVEGCIVFVVSQDGHLRVFASDADHVYLFDNLAAEVRLRDKS
jgi:DisA bacterial checkpoint controller nucleotide-binding